MADAPGQKFDLPDLCRPLAEASPAPIAALEGASHIFGYVNPAFCLLLGKAKEELIGKTFASAMPPEQDCLSLLDRVYQTGQSETHTEVGQLTPHLFWSYAMWPVTVDGHPAGILIQITETTLFHREMAAMNQELLLSSVRQHELTEQAEDLNVKLRRTNTDLKQFAFAASHDLQEPLRMIALYTELLVNSYNGQLDDQAAQYAAFITRGAERMHDLLTDLLAYTRMGEQEPDAAEPVDLNAILQRVMQNMKALIDETGTVLEFENLPTVQGRDAHFVQLFQNLIGNAIKYRGENTPRIHISAERLKGEWRFAVADNGMGIDPAYHRQIFGVFKRLHGKSIPGTGIGLAICQRVVERYGGRIWVESQEGRGSTFYFTLAV